MGGRVGPFELLIVLAVILLFFGANKLPGLARSLGRSLGEFNKGRAEGENGTPKQPEADVKAAKDAEKPQEVPQKGRDWEDKPKV